MIFNGLLLFPYAFVVVECLRFEMYSVTRKVFIFFFGCVSIIIVFIPWKDIYFLALMMGALIPMVDQPMQILKRGVGSIEIRYTFTFLFSSIFWFGYGIFAKNIPLQITGIGAIVISLSIIILFFMFRKGS